MRLLPTEDLDKVTPNRYQAVIIASKHARHLNLKRLARLQQLEADATVDIDSRKITMVAMKELLEGKVQFKMSDTE